MITNTTAKSTYVVAEGVTEYAVGFTFGYNPDLTPQIKVYVNKLSNTPLVYGIDYTISQNQLNIVLLTQFNAGDRLDIIRDIPFVQISDYVIGRIDPEQIEKDLDLAVERDQQLKGDLQYMGEVPQDHENRIQECESDIDDLESLVPAQATDVNQLADKEFVNSSIATSTATFKGTYSSLAELEEVPADDNDYGFVVSTDATGNTVYSRYKCANGSWVFEYNLNNSSFTAEQWAAINSGITAGIVDNFNATGHNVGDIFLTMRNDNELNGAVECDGATYNTTDFTGAQSIGQLLSAGKVPYVSLSAYADEITAKGWCDKFGWDGVGTTAFKVPTLNAYIWQKLNTPVVGTGKGLGLIGSSTGTWAGRFNGQGNNATDYVILNTFNVDPGTGGGGDWIGGGAIGVVTDPTKSALTTDTTGIVSDQRVMVQLAITATDEAVETCTSVLADVAELKYDYVVDFQAPTAENNYTWYRKYKSGWVEQGGTLTYAGSVSNYTVNLPIEMADANYQTSVTLYGNTSGHDSSVNGVYFTAWSRTATSFITKLYNAQDVQQMWEVKGMAANN